VEPGLVPPLSIAVQKEAAEADEGEHVERRVTQRRCEAGERKVRPGRRDDGAACCSSCIQFAELFLEPKGFTGAQASAAAGGTHDWIESADGITVLCASAASDRRGWRNTGAPLAMPSAPSVSCTAVRTVSCIIEPPHEGASHSVPGVAVLTYVSKVTETIGSQQPRPHVEEDTKLIRMQELNALVRLCRRKAGIAARCAALHTARAQPPLRAAP